METNQGNQDSSGNQKNVINLLYLLSRIFDYIKSNQGNQDSSGNQKNVIQGQRPDIENNYFVDQQQLTIK